MNSNLPPQLNVVLQTEPEVSLPNKFQGSRKCSATDFKDSVETIFHLQPRRFPTDEVKILFISTFLVDSAHTWFKSLRKSNDPALLSLSSFWNAFQSRFGNLFVDEEAESKLLNLTQGKKERVDEFNLRFLTIASMVNFDDRAFRGIYMKAISPDILEHLFHVSPFPETFQEIMRESELIDSRNRQIALRRVPPSSSFTRSFQNLEHPKQRTTFPESHQMDISAIKVVKLDDAEKKRRQELNLCRYCGDSSHQAIQCPKLQSKNLPARR